MRDNKLKKELENNKKQIQLQGIYLVFVLGMLVGNYFTTLNATIIMMVGYLLLLIYLIKKYNK